MTKKRRNYTREFKLEAIRLSEASGKSNAQVSKSIPLRAKAKGIAHLGDSFTQKHT